MHAHRLVVLLVGHGYKCNAAASRKEHSVLFGNVDSVDSVRATFHAEQLQIKQRGVADWHSRFSLSATEYSTFLFNRLALRLNRLAPLSAVSAQFHQPDGPLLLRSFFALTHEQSSMSESLMWHTLDTNGALVNVAQASGDVAKMRHKQLLVALQVVAFL